MTLVTMIKEELDRFSVIRDVIARRMWPRAAADLLGISRRQLFRLKAHYLAHGAQGLVHNNAPRQNASCRTTCVARPLLLSKTATLTLGPRSQEKNFNSCMASAPPQRRPANADSWAFRYRDQRKHSHCSSVL